MKIHHQNKKTQISYVIPMIVIGVGLIVIGLISAKVITADSVSAEGYGVVPQQVSFTAPDITLNALTGETVSISDYQGQVILINNWATWCPPCKAEMPTLSKYYQDHRDESFVLVAIEAGDPKDDVARFVQEYDLTFPVLLDPNNKALYAFRNDSLPSSYVVDQNGTVVLAWTGPITYTTLEKYVTPLLEQ
jgi:cytochrome c biogenesis protein CcmG, thiol:disulfide interchange protein DsbE